MKGDERLVAITEESDSYASETDLEQGNPPKPEVPKNEHGSKVIVLPVVKLEDISAE